MDVTDLKITEAETIQFPMGHAEEIGWTPLPPRMAVQLRGGEAGMLFRGELRGRICGRTEQVRVKHKEWT